MWDTPAICPASISSMCAQLDDVLAWADVIITVYRSARDKLMHTRASNEPLLKCDNHGKGLSQDLVKLEDHDQWSALRIYSNKPVPYDL